MLSGKNAWRVSLCQLALGEVVWCGGQRHLGFGCSSGYSFFILLTKWNG